MSFIENVYIKDGEYTKIIYTMVHTELCMITHTHTHIYIYIYIYIYVYKFEIFI